MPDAPEKMKEGSRLVPAVTLHFREQNHLSMYGFYVFFYTSDSWHLFINAIPTWHFLFSGVSVCQKLIKELAFYSPVLSFKILSLCIPPVCLGTTYGSPEREYSSQRGHSVFRWKRLQYIRVCGDLWLHRGTTGQQRGYMNHKKLCGSIFCLVSTIESCKRFCHKSSICTLIHYQSEFYMLMKSFSC